MSGVSERAEIEASLTGLPGVLAGLQTWAKEIGGVAKAIDGRLGGAPKKVFENLKAVTSEGLRAAGVLSTISLGRAVEEAKRFDQVTAHLGLNARTSVAELQTRFKGLEGRVLTSAPVLADFSAQLGRATYNGKGAAAAVEGLGLEALATGRTLQEQLQLGETLHNGLGVVGETITDLDRLRAIADRVDTVGGHLALQDSLVALQPQLEGVVTNSDAARAKLEALVAVLGKGLKPGQATATAGAALSQLRARALDIERATGKQVINDQGELIDPTETLKNLKRRSNQIHGGNQAEQRRALISTYGPELGLAILRTNFDDVDSVAQETGTGATAAAAQEYASSAPGRREQVEVAKDRAQRDVGERLLGVQDTLISTLGENTTAIIELTAGLASGVNLLSLAAGALGIGGGAGAAASGGAGGGLLSTVSGLGATGAALVAGVTASFALPAAAVLNEVGEDRDVQGARYRKEHANILGAELANAAVAAGDLTPVIGRAGGDKDVIAAALVQLEARFGDLNETLRTQVAAGIAAELRREPLKVVAPRDPNAPRGN